MEATSSASHVTAPVGAFMEKELAFSQAVVDYKAKVEKKYNKGIVFQDYNVSWKRVYRALEFYTWTMLLDNSKNEEEALLAIEAGADAFCNCRKDCKCNSLIRIINKNYCKVITILIDKCINMKRGNFKLLIMLNLSISQAKNRVFRTIINNPNAGIIFDDYYHIRPALFRAAEIMDLDLTIRTLDIRRQYNDKLVNAMCDFCKESYFHILQLFETGNKRKREEAMNYFHSLKKCKHGCKLSDVVRNYGNYLRVDYNKMFLDACKNACLKNNTAILELLLREPWINPSYKEPIKYIHANYSPKQSASVISLLLYHPKVWNNLSEEDRIFYASIPGVSGG